ncbi:MAG: hypothetical protein ACOVLC_09550 [Flavobacterium sp.]
MKIKIIHFMVAFVLFTTIMYFGILWLSNEADRATIGKQSLFFGLGMSIFEVLVIDQIRKNRRKQ